MDHRSFIENQFKFRKQQNPAYSLRAFARDLGLDPSTLSKVLKGERNIPLSSMESVATRLNLGAKNTEKFLSSVLQSKGFGGTSFIESYSKSVKTLKNDTHFKIISEWEHLAFLNLIKVKDFKSDLNWIKDRLGISIERCKLVFNNLLQANMVEVNSQGEFSRLHPKLTTSDDILSLALKIRHREDLKKASLRLWDTPIEERDICSVVLPINTKKIKKAKKITRKYFKEMESLLESENPDEVYQLSVQLFPLSTQFHKKLKNKYLNSQESKK